MALNSTINAFSSIAGSGDASGVVQHQIMVGELLRDYARKVFNREFMAKLKGDNENIKLDVAFGTVKDAGSRELAKAA
jgi:hypothetical protein